MFKVCVIIAILKLQVFPFLQDSKGQKMTSQKIILNLAIFSGNKQKIPARINFQECSADYYTTIVLKVWYTLFSYICTQFVMVADLFKYKLQFF